MIARIDTPSAELRDAPSRGTDMFDRDLIDCPGYPGEPHDSGCECGGSALLAREQSIVLAPDTTTGRLQRFIDQAQAVLDELYAIAGHGHPDDHAELLAEADEIYARITNDSPHPTTHQYRSTACIHEQAATDSDEQKHWRRQCRYFCKYCPAACDCPCHADAGEPYPGYDAATEDRLRQELRDAIAAAGIQPGPRQAELLVDIVLSVLAGIAKESQADEAPQ